MQLIFLTILMLSVTFQGTFGHGKEDAKSGGKQRFGSLRQKLGRLARSKKASCGVPAYNYNDFKCDPKLNRNYGCGRFRLRDYVVGKYCWRSCDGSPECREGSKERDWCYSAIESEDKKSHILITCDINNECLSYAALGCQTKPTSGKVKYANPHTAIERKYEGMLYEAKLEWAAREENQELLGGWFTRLFLVPKAYNE